MIVTDDLLVAITARADGQGAEPGRSTRLTLREEVIDPEPRHDPGRPGRSELTLDLDCSGHRLIVGARRIYDRPNLQGSVRITRSENVWVQTPADTVIDEVARAACSPQPPAPLTEIQPVAASSRQASDTAAERAAAAQAQPAAPPAPAPELRKVSADPPAALHNPSPGGGGQNADPRTPGPSRRLSAPLGGAALPAQFAVQIAAVANADLARDAWQSLKARLPDLIGPRTFAVEPVSGQGRTQYRALLLGFSSSNEAMTLCKTLRSRSADCVLRQMK